MARSIMTHLRRPAVGRLVPRQSIALALTAALVTSLAMAAQAPAQSPGDLTPAGCIENTGGSVCGPGNQAAGLTGARSVAVSPDGTSAYVAGAGSHAIVAFDRAADGSLSNPRCKENTGGSLCGAGNQVPGLDGASDVIVSPDGTSVYVASNFSSAIVGFDRAPNGNLSNPRCKEITGGSACGAGNQAPGLGGARSVAVSPDGTSVYVASGLSNAVVAFDRAPNGNLSNPRCKQDTGASTCGAGNQTSGLDTANGVAVSPDGGSVYVTGQGDNAVVAFDRGANGNLSSPRCVQNAGGSDCGSGSTTPGLAAPHDVAISPDGASVYVASNVSSAIVTFDRAANGNLSSPRCIGDTGLGDCGFDNQAPGLGTADGVAVSPDGASVYVGSAFNGAIAAFDRDAGGNLSNPRCIANTGQAACGPGNTTPGLDGARGVAVSPDGGSVYVASEHSHAVVAFDREPPEPPPPPEPEPVVDSVEISEDTPVPTAGCPLVVTAKLAGPVVKVGWNVDRDPAFDVVGNASQSSLYLVPSRSGSLQVTATPIGASGPRNPFVATISVAKLRSSGFRRSRQVSGSSCLAAKVLQGPLGNLKPQIDAIRHLARRGPSVAAVAPDWHVAFSRAAISGPKPCVGNSTMQAGSLQVSGCLRPIRSLDDMPVTERGVFSELSDRLRGSPAAAALNATLEQLGGFKTDGLVSVNGLSVFPQDKSSVLFFPSLEAVAASNAKVFIGELKHRFQLDNPKRFLLDIGQKAGGAIPIGPLPRLPGGLDKLGWLKLTGDVKVELKEGDPPYAEITAKLVLPRWLSIGGLKAEGEVKFRTTVDRGLILDNMRIGPIDVNVGAMAVKEFQIEYTAAAEQWHGQGKACFGQVVADVIKEEACLNMVPDKGDILITRDDLTRAHTTLEFPSPGVAVGPSVFLNHISFGLGLNPTRLLAGAGLTASGIYDINGKAVIAFPSSRVPFVLDPNEIGGFPAHFYGIARPLTTFALSGNAGVRVPLLGRIQLANGYFLYEFNPSGGYLGLGGSVDQDFLGVFRLGGGVDGEFNARNGRFNLHGRTEACFTGFTEAAKLLLVEIDLNICRGAEGHISNRGAAACASIVISFGLGVSFETGDVTPYVFKCPNWSDYRELNVRRAKGVSLRGGGASGTLPLEATIARGEPARALLFESAEGAPRVRVTGPGGQFLDSPEGSTAFATETTRIMRLEQSNVTVVGLMEPGTYRVEELPGSPPITRIAESKEAPDAEIEARVEADGERRTLAYEIDGLAGRKVTFVEKTATGTARQIGTVGDARGQLSFTPAPGNDRRRIEAQVEVDGTAVDTQGVASFRPPSPSLARPRSLRTRRTSHGLRVAWRKVAGATGYEVVITPDDGRQRLIRTRRHSLAVRRLPRSVAVQVGVRAVAPLREGRPRTAHVRRAAARDSGFEPLPRPPRYLRSREADASP